MSTETEVQSHEEETAPEEKREFRALRVIGWISAGMAVAALGVYLGCELRSRYKFNHRTPYDFYAHAGEKQTGEFGLGI